MQAPRVIRKRIDAGPAEPPRIPPLQEMDPSPEQVSGRASIFDFPYNMISGDLRGLRVQPKNYWGKGLQMTVLVVRKKRNGTMQLHLAYGRLNIVAVKNRYTQL